MLTKAQQVKAIHAYEQAGIPYARLAHSGAIIDMAYAVNATAKDIWNFLRKSRPKGHKLPKTCTSFKLPELDAGYCAMFECQLAEHIGVAESFVYTTEFMEWCEHAGRSHRSKNAWATDLIRYRKAKYKLIKNHTAAMLKASGSSDPTCGGRIPLPTGEFVPPVTKINFVPEQGSGFPFGGCVAINCTIGNAKAPAQPAVEPPLVLTPLTGPIVAEVPGGFLYIGLAPVPPTGTFVGQVSEDQMKNFQREFKRDKVSNGFYRLDRATIDWITAIIRDELVG